MDASVFYQTYQPFVYSVAYRMLGTVSDAEDVAQEIFLISQRVDKTEVKNMKAYLMKITTNYCLNILKSARKKREVYTGEWLPEPEIDPIQQDPAHMLIQKEQISYALLVLLEALTPIERAVFVLRETFGYEYQEIAEILNKTESNCRKIYSRSKKKLPPEISIYPRESSHAEHMVKTFIKGAKSGNFDEFIRLLASDAVLVTDGGGKVRSAIFPILGKQRIHIFLEAVNPRGFLQTEVIPTKINGQIGFVVKNNGHVERTICFEWDSSKQVITRIYAVLNKDKLSHIQL